MSAEGGFGGSEVVGGGQEDLEAALTGGDEMMSWSSMVSSAYAGKGLRAAMTVTPPRM